MTDDTVAQAAADAQAVANATSEVSVEELLAARERAATTAAAHYDVAAGQVAIFDPEHESLSYGPMSDIVFGPKGGFEPNVWVGPANHPLIEQMLLNYPKMFRIGTANKVYVCDKCEKEWTSVQSLRMHKVSAHGGATKE